MEERNKGLIILGIILLAIGLVAASYHELTPAPGSYCMLMAYPYLIIGLELSLAGLVFIALGFLYPTRKTPPPTNPQQQKTNWSFKLSQQMPLSGFRKGFLVVGIVLLILGFVFFYEASIEYRNYVTTFTDTVNVSLPVPLKIADYGFGDSLVFPTSFPDIRMRPNDLIIVECPSDVSAGQIAVKVYVVLFGNTSMLKYSKAEVLACEMGYVEYVNHKSNEIGVGVYLAIPAWNIPNNVTMLNTAAVPVTITIGHYETLHWVYYGIGVVLASLAVIPIFKSKK